MKIISVKICKQNSCLVNDCCVGDGYVKVAHASFPDIDTDFDAEKRDEVKRYLETRYNTASQQRVFSAGAFTTIKVKSAMKDIAAVHKIPRSTTNYVTKIIGEQDFSWTELMKMAVKDKRIYDFIQKYPTVFEEMLPLLGQPRSSSIHPSAIITIPELIKGQRLNCYEMLPIKKQNDMLVSEISGYDVDDVGFLKSDVLGIAELSRIDETLQIIKKEYDKTYTLYQLTQQGFIDDPLIYSELSKGKTQGIFQFSSPDMTRFIKRLGPTNIHDMITANALYRPATIESGSVQKFIDLKHGDTEPEYLWGCYDALKNTMGILAFQEQITQIARDVGGFSLGDGVKLAKFISKKKVDKILAQKDKFMAGAAKKGCPKDAAQDIWKLFEVAGKYSFNASHSTAYALTACASMWLKVHYPVAFYTVQLKWVADNKLPTLMNEIDDLVNVQLVKPDINISIDDFYTDFKNGIIYWSLARIKYVGAKAVWEIVKNRNINGKFISLRDFVVRIYKTKLKKNKYKGFTDDDLADDSGRNAVTTRHLKQLIISGAFDEVEHITNPAQRYILLKGAARMLGFELNDKDAPEEMRDKPYYWQQKQIDITGFGAIDYNAIISKCEAVPSSISGTKRLNLKILSQTTLMPEKYVMCATIAEVVCKSYKDKKTGATKHYGKIVVRQNNYLGLLTIWGDAWEQCRDKFVGKVNRLVIAVVHTEWSDYDEQNVLKLNRNAFVCNPDEV